MNISDATKQAAWRGVKTFLMVLIMGYAYQLIDTHTFAVTEAYMTDSIGTAILTALGMGGLKRIDGAKYPVESKK